YVLANGGLPALPGVGGDVTATDESVAVALATEEATGEVDATPTSGSGFILFTQAPVDATEDANATAAPTISRALPTATVTRAPTDAPDAPTEVVTVATNTPEPPTATQTFTPAPTDTPTPIPTSRPTLPP